MVAAATVPLLLTFGTSAAPQGAWPDARVVVAGADSASGVVSPDVEIAEVVVSTGGGGLEGMMRSSVGAVSVCSAAIEEGMGASLAETLRGVAGVRAMPTGAGGTKPLIRGLGFNRVVVADNGFKHQGQQWGDDHPLEADQNAIDAAEVVRGPASLTFGSDAIGGVLNMRSDAAPTAPLGVRARAQLRSMDEAAGLSVSLSARRSALWVKAHATVGDHADRRVTADSIRYHSYHIRLHRGRLRNTAGRKAAGGLMAGLEGDRLRAWARATVVSSRGGLFANAHGLEVRLSPIDYDRSRRDVDLPLHDVTHLMLSSRAELRAAGGIWAWGAAWQSNSREERSEPVSHGYMPTPRGTLERLFRKRTATFDAGFRRPAGRHSLRMGASAELVRNRRGGWGFILPDFGQWAAGVFAADRFVVSDGLIVSAGVRADAAGVRVRAYRDWYKTPVEGGDSVYAERSADLCKTFRSLTWSAGVNARVGDAALKVNLGKSFRTPTPKELGMDGVNYSLFRYEQGNATLRPEEAYQLDVGVAVERGGMGVELSPFANFFSNYIYLDPTPSFREGLQFCRYTQCRVGRWGGEASVGYRWDVGFSLRADGEWLAARQLSGPKRGYALPYSLPWTARLRARHDFAPARGGTSFAEATWEVVGTQSAVVPPEERTPGHHSFSAALGRTFRFGGHTARCVARCDNILDRRFFDHSNPLRLIGVPEPGRSFSLVAAWEL